MIAGRSLLFLCRNAACNLMYSFTCLCKQRNEPDLRRVTGDESLCPVFATFAHRNCRNTENISETAVSLLKKSEKRTFLLTADTITGKIPCIHFCEDVGSSLSALDEILDGLKRDGIDDIVIHGTR